MSEGILVAFLVLVGLLLVLLEVLLVPGTTFVGIAGLVLLLAGVALAYYYLGPLAGNLALAGSALVGGGGLFWGLRRRSWQRFSLNTSLSGRVNEAAQQQVAAGQQGKSISALRPSGTAEIGGERYEVHTNGEFLPPETPLKVLKVDRYKIIVEADNPNPPAS